MKSFIKQAALGTALVAGAILLARRRHNNRHGLDLEAHTSETEVEYRNARHRILILGAGFGGLNAALALDRRLRKVPDTSILLADRNNDLLFAPLLWIVANGRANPSDVMVPVRTFQRGRDFHVLYTDVNRIDLEERVVTTAAGPRPYDYLVIALGSHTTLPDLPGLREHALLFHN